MKISQTPALRRRMGWRRVSHSLKSPATDTVAAFGAHTAKRTPGTPATVVEMRPERIPCFVERAFGMQVEIEVGDDRAEAVRVFEQSPLRRASPRCGTGRRPGSASSVATNSPSRCRFSIGISATRGRYDRGRFGLRQEGADLPRGFACLVVVGWGPSTLNASPW